MIKRTSMVMVLLALLAVPGTADAQRRGGGAGGQGLPGQRGMQPPAGAQVGRQIRAALMNREALGLTGAQVTALEELRDRMHEELQGFRAAMMASREARRGQAREEARQDREARREQMEALRQRAEELHAPYLEEFEQMLTEEQRERLPELTSRGPARGGQGGPGGRRGRGGR